MFAFVGACALLAASAAPAPPSDTAEVKAVIEKWVADFNKADFESFVAACAPGAAVVDGFPPYAWGNCNEILHATHGKLEIGEPIYEERNGPHAYLIYPATFSDTQDGKPVVYKGTWTITLTKTKDGWVFTGSASAWGVNTL